jgi:hypothetical protein
MVQHQVFGQNRHDICQSTGAVEAFLGQQMGMASAKQKDASFPTRRFSHPPGNFHQEGALTLQDARLEFSHRLKISVESSDVECHRFCLHTPRLVCAPPCSLN